ncbi:NAD(P)H-binding protein, partial [Staphylococcus sp. KY49P]|nr:NAD(P)H-binding protein [Staphylococcus sp. KY49P]
MTVVTGFLGGAVLEKILTSDQSVKLLLLARSGDPQSGLARVQENMRKFNISEEKLASLSVDNILIGDLSQPEAFLNDPRLDQVTHVVNCAA